MRRLCVGQPPELWEVGDDGNRLALALCRVCPQLGWCSSTSVDERGVIRAGVAYGDTGRVLPVCRCGYPNRKQPAWDGTVNPLCHRCAPPPSRTWDPDRKKYWREQYRRRKERAA